MLDQETMAEDEIYRHIEGGTATFGAGYELSTFHLGTSSRLTSKLSVKADANTVLIAWQPTSKHSPTTLRETLEIVGGPLRFSHRATSRQRERWQATTVAGFYQPEHALAVLESFKRTRLGECRTLYTVYFTAPTELTDAMIVDVEEIASQAEVDIAWEEPRQSRVTLRLSGVDKSVIIDMKKIYEAIFSGHIAFKWSKSGDLPSNSYEIWHEYFASLPGDVWLKHLGRETSTIITSDKLQQRLRIYDLGDGTLNKDLVEEQLIRKIAELTATQEAYTVQLDLKQLRSLISSDIVAAAHERLGKANVNLDIMRKVLVLRCSRQAAWEVTYELGLPMPQSAPNTTKLECSQCGENTKDVELSCGHVSCGDCFDHHVHVASSDLTGNHFPLRCWHQNCGQPVSIPDLRKYATASGMDALLGASLTFYIRSNPSTYRNCRTPDCRSVYLRNGSYEIFTCPSCLVQTCTLCHSEPHTGWTCAEYYTQLRKNQDNEELLDKYKVTAGTKDCPKCTTLIEKVDGCNHVECSGCHGHLCWTCMKVFAKSEAAYQHMNDVHGGNGLEETEEEEEDSDTDSDEEYSDSFDDVVEWYEYGDPGAHWG
jgi:hypothetical protein